MDPRSPDYIVELQERFDEIARGCRTCGVDPPKGSNGCSCPLFAPLERIASGISGATVKIGPRKTRTRCIEKAKNNEKRLDTIRDPRRASVECTSLAVVRALLERIDQGNEYVFPSVLSVVWYGFASHAQKQCEDSL